MYVCVSITTGAEGVPYVYIGLIGSGWKVPGAFLSHNQALYGDTAQPSVLSLFQNICKTYETFNY